MKDQSFKDQTVVVTGANRGLGLEFARQLSRAGAQVIATARDPGAAHELAAITPEVRVEALDVADPASVATFAERLGDVAVDVLINNAGTGGSERSLAQLDFARLAEAFAINSLGALRVTQELLPHLRRGERQTIVSLSSIMGSFANNSGGYYGYRASKGALNMLMSVLARELAPKGFICLLIHPGWVRTDMGGANATLSPAESVAGILRVVTRAGREDNGRFLDYTGAEIAW